MYGGLSERENLVQEEHLRTHVQVALTTPGDSQPCRFSHISMTCAGLKTAKPTAIRCDGASVHSNVPGVTATT